MIKLDITIDETSDKKIHMNVIEDDVKNLERTFMNKLQKLCSKYARKMTPKKYRLFMYKEPHEQKGKL